MTGVSLLRSNEMCRRVWRVKTMDAGSQSFVTRLEAGTGGWLDSTGGLTSFGVCSQNCALTISLVLCNNGLLNDTVSNKLLIARTGMTCRDTTRIRIEMEQPAGMYYELYVLPRRPISPLHTDTHKHTRCTILQNGMTGVYHTVRLYITHAWTD